MSDRKFVCDVEPRGDGWEVWISEEPYRGVDTDAALHHWDRVRRGAAWSSRRLVGRRRHRRAAVQAARRALSTAQATAAIQEGENAAWRANVQRTAVRIESSSEQP